METIPKWAKYRATNYDGWTYWYENEPTVGVGEWCVSSGQSMGCGNVPHWINTLEKIQQPKE
jgi:hypothetical protein